MTARRADRSTTAEVRRQVRAPGGAAGGDGGRRGLVHMTRERWLRIAVGPATGGGACWVAKAATIVATDGRIDDEGAAAVFYLAGLALMVVGSPAVGTLAAGGHVGSILTLALVLSPLLFFASFVALAGLARGRGRRAGTCLPARRGGHPGHRSGMAGGRADDCRGLGTDTGQAGVGRSWIGRRRTGRGAGTAGSTSRASGRRGRARARTRGR